MEPSQPLCIKLKSGKIPVALIPHFVVAKARTRKGGEMGLRRPNSSVGNMDLNVMHYYFVKITKLICLIF